MRSHTTGIGDVQLYVPAPWIATTELVSRRAAGDAGLEARLSRAAAYTGQEAFRFTQPWEDSATLAAAASRGVLARRDGVDGLRYLLTGTETSVDHSKPVASYVTGMLDKAGVSLPSNHTAFQVQHACAGGTLSLLSIAALLAAGGAAGEYGLAVCTDIARYIPGSTGEITQGAGAVALLVEHNPALLELDLQTPGYVSRDVDDFFRPVGSDEARVKGQYSIRCYRSALNDAFEDHCRRAGSSPRAVLEAADFFVLHVPYYSLPLDSMRMLLKKHLDMEAEAADAFLAARGFQESIAPARRIGNLYSGSMYMSLVELLMRQHARSGAGIVGKKILFASYGSGNTMIVFSGTVASRAPGVIARWRDLPPDGPAASWEEYLAWNGQSSWDARYNAVLERAGRERVHGFYLDSIREDGYREYRFRE
jgi:hydroxymethylglutaryl-CoA synthase